MDFTLFAHVKSDMLYCVPLEAKKVVEMKHMAQLSEYQGTLYCGGVLRKYVSVGMLVDEHKVRFVFSPWCYEDSVPVPITLVSPVMKWRHGPVVSRAVCTALCLVPTLVVPRFKIDVDMAATAFAERLEHIRDIAMQNKGKISVTPSQEGVPYNIMVEVKELKAEVATLKRALTWSSPAPIHCPQIDCSTPRRRKRARCAPAFRNALPSDQVDHSQEEEEDLDREN